MLPTILAATSLALVVRLGGLTAGQEAAEPPADSLAAEPFILEEENLVASFENDGTSVRTDTLRARIQTEAGLQPYSVLTFPYQSAMENVTVEYTRVRKPDGSVVETPPENVQDMPAPITREAPFYSDVHEKHISVKGLAVGDVVEARLTWRVTKPIVPGQFWFVMRASLDAIVRSYTLQVSVPKDRLVRWHSGATQPQITEEGPRRIFRVTASQLKPRRSKQAEAGREEREKQSDAAEKPQEDTDRTGVEATPLVDFAISSFASWEAVGNWYGTLSKDASHPTPEVRAKAAELTAGLKTDDDRALAIYKYVSSQIRYIGVAFGIGRYQPHAAAEVLVNQYGDCKDKTALLVALLAAADLKALPALISSGRDVEESVPSPGQFDHLIAALRRGDGKYVWLDTTAEVAPFGYLVTPLRGKHALVVSTDGPPALLEVPADPPKPFHQTYSMDATLGEDGVLEGKASWSLDGDDGAVVLRAALRRATMAQWKDLAQYLSLRSGFGGEVRDVRFDYANDPEQPLRWSYAYTRKDYSDWPNRRITPPLPAMILPKAPDTATAPMKLGIPGEVVFEATLKLPKGSAPRLPPDRRLDEPFAEFVSSYLYKDGVLRSVRRLVVKKREVSPAELDRYRQFAKAIDSDHEKYIPLHGAARLSMFNYNEAIWDLSYSGSDEASRAYDDARAAYDKKDTQGEILALERAIRIDPKFTRARLWLGNIHRSEGHNKTALDAYRKAVENDPDEPLTYKVLAYNQMLQGNSEDALGTWRQLLAVAPQDADGWEGLGMASVMANRNHEAAEALEKALELDSSRTDLRVQLGYAYLKDGRDAKGVEELRKGLETVSEPPMLNNAAWVLAETKKELPLALEYAERAVAAEEAATAKTRLGSLTMEDLQHAVALGVYWDTLGLVHAQMEHLQTARKYLDASWRLTQSSLVGRNLADVAQKQGKIDEAKRLRRLATAARRGSDVLWIGPGSKPKVDAQDEADQNDVALREELASLRTIKLPALTSKTASGEFFLLVGADSKVVEAKFLSGDELLNKSTKALEGASVGGALPARQEVRIVRRGVVSCAPSSGCSIVLYTPDTVRSLE